jgi:hypothetical protein
MDFRDLLIRLSSLGLLYLRFCQACALDSVLPNVPHVCPLRRFYSHRIEGDTQYAFNKEIVRTLTRD